MQLKVVQLTGEPSFSDMVGSVHFLFFHVKIVYTCICLYIDGGLRGNPEKMKN